MNNEKILTIMENLSKAVYDIAATTKHIYKDEHPTGPTMPMPTMPGQPKFPPPALWSNQTNQFPPQQFCPPPVMVRQPERYGGLGFKPITNPKEPWHDKQRPIPSGPNQFCNMQDYTFQQLNGNVPPKATILADPFMKANQPIETDPDPFHNMIDLAGGVPEPIGNLIKEHPDALEKATANVQKMNPSLGICQNLGNGKLDKDIDALGKKLNEMTRTGTAGEISIVSDQLIGLTLARSYLSFPVSDSRKKFILEELKGNPVALKAFNEAVEDNEAMRAKALAERQYGSQRVMSQKDIGVGNDLKASMENYFNPKPSKPVPVPPVMSSTPSKQDLVQAAMTKQYLESIDAKESVGKMTDMLDKCNDLAKTPAAPGNEVMKEAEISLTEENLKKDASEIKADDRPVIPKEEEIPEIPEIPITPKELPKANLVKKKNKVKKADS